MRREYLKRLWKRLVLVPKAIVDRFVEQGVPVKGLIGLGGVAKKSPYIMQVMADVMNMPIRIHRSEHTCAMGAAMFAATAAGIYKKVEEAMAAWDRVSTRNIILTEQILNIIISATNSTKNWAHL